MCTEPSKLKNKHVKSACNVIDFVAHLSPPGGLQPLCGKPLATRWLASALRHTPGHPVADSHFAPHLWPHNGWQPLCGTPLPTRWLAVTFRQTLGHPLDGSHLAAQRWPKIGWSPLCGIPVAPRWLAATFFISLQPWFGCTAPSPPQVGQGGGREWRTSPALRQGS